MKFKKGTKAVVCGSSGGIGAEVARQLAAQGVTVTLVSRSHDKLEAVKKELHGERHQVFAADLTQDSDVLGLAKFLSENGDYQIFVNNSGGPKGGPLMSAETENFEQGLKAHILSAQSLLKVLVPQMKSLGTGRVVNIISTSVRIPIPNLGVSNTIRGAVASWSKTLSLELGPSNITVNNVLPGYTKTQRLETLIEAAAKRLNQSTGEVEKAWKAKVPMGRFAEVSEVAHAVCYLCSEEASYINGVSLPVDGGRTGAI